MEVAEQLDIPPEGFTAEHTFEDGTTLLLHRILWHLCRHIAAHDKEVRVSILLDLLSKVDEGVIPQKLAEISRYLDEVKSETPCRPDTFSAHLMQIRELWIRLRGKMHKNTNKAFHFDALLQFVIFRQLGLQLAMGSTCE